jgi:hypothetical protein
LEEKIKQSHQHSSTRNIGTRQRAIQIILRKSKTII